MLIDAADYGLSPGGGPGPLLSRTVPITGASKAGQDYSELGPGPQLAPPSSFAGRSGFGLQPVDVVDVALLSATEEPVDSQDVYSTDTARLTVTETVQVLRHFAVTDIASLAASEVIALVVTGVTSKSASDTASLTVTESIEISVSVAVTDNAALSVSESSTVDVSVETIPVSDSASLSVDDQASVTIFVGVNEKTALDIASLSASETASVLAETPPVTEPIKSIRFELRGPSMRFEFL